MSPRRTAFLSLAFALALAGLFGSSARADEHEAPGPSEPPPGRIAELLALQGQGEPAMAAFREALRDPRATVRAAAVQLLAKEAGPGSIPSIAPLATDPDASVVTAAGLALVAFDADDVVEPVRRALASENPGVRAQIAAAIGDRRASRLGPLLGVLVSDTVPDVRATAVEALRAIGSPEGYPFLMAATADAHGEIAAAAVDALRQLGDPRALDRIPKLAKSDAPVVRKAVAVAIPGLGGVGTHKDAMASLMADPDLGVRIAALSGLRDAPTPDALPLLAQRFEEPDARARRLVVAAARATPGPSAVDLVVRFLSDKDEDVRGSAVTALASRQTVDRFTAVAALAADPAPSVRAAVAIALGEFGNPEGLGAIRGLAADKDVIVRGRAVAAAGAIGTSKALPIVTAALADPHVSVRLEAVSALGAIGGSDAFAKLRKQTRSGDLQVRLASIAVLGRAKDAGSVATLKSLRSDPLEPIRAAASRALAEIGAPDDTRPR